MLELKKTGPNFSIIKWQAYLIIINSKCVLTWLQQFIIPSIAALSYIILDTWILAIGFAAYQNFCAFNKTLVIKSVAINTI